MRDYTNLNKRINYKGNQRVGEKGRVFRSTGSEMDRDFKYPKYIHNEITLHRFGSELKDRYSSSWTKKNQRKDEINKNNKGE